MPQNPTRPPSANPGGERGMFNSMSNAGTGPTKTPRPQTANQRALNPGRVAHAASEARGASRGQRRGIGIGTAIGAGVVGTAAIIKGQYDKTMAENAKFDAFNRGKVAGRQTNSSGGKDAKSTYQAPVTKALMADGAKPVTKPK